MQWSECAAAGMEKTLVASYANGPLISHHRLPSPGVVKVSSWRPTQSRLLSLQSSQQRRRLTLSSNSTTRIVSLFGGGKGKGKEGGDLTGKDAAIKALEQAFGGKKNPFSKWVETQNLDADMGGNDKGGDDGRSGGRGGSSGYKDEGKPEDVLQTIIAYLAFIFMYLWMLFREDMESVVRAVRRWFRDNADWEDFIDWSEYYFEVFKYTAFTFLFGREEYEDEPEFYTLSEIFGALRLFWNKIFIDEEQQIKDCKEFESLLKDLLEYKRHGHN